MTQAPAPPDPSLETEDARLRRILRQTRTIACIGVSANPVRPSHYVARYLALKGYRVIPVNPGIAGQTLFGARVVGDLSEIDGPVDMIDLFRRPEHVPALVAQALEVFPALRTVWMQIGVISDEAAAMARERGAEVVMDRCPKLEYQRLFGELRMAGAATGIVSSRL